MQSRIWATLLALVLMAGCQPDKSTTEVKSPQTNQAALDAGTPKPEPVETPDLGKLTDAGSDTDGAAEAVQEGPYAPISKEALAELQQVRADPEPEELTQGRHYVTSDEYAHYLFRKVIDDMGGVYIGLGTDQNYFLAGWSKPDVMILYDFDQYIVDLHSVYGVLFKRAKTPVEFLELFSTKMETSVVEDIQKAFPDEKTAKKLTKMYTRHRRQILRRLKFTQKTCQLEGVDTFVDNQKQYDHIAGLWREGRVMAVRGDLTKDKTMADIAAWAKKHKQTVRTVYLSNAEYYFPFETGSYRSNISGLPMDEKSLFVHTFPRSKKFYKYVFETGPTYQAWVTSGKVADLRELIRKASRRVEPQFYMMTKMPDGTEPNIDMFKQAEVWAEERKKAIEDPSLATVELTANPNGFLVIDNRRVGVVTPGKIRLKPGKHKIRLKFETGELSEEQEIEVKKGQKLTLEFEPPPANSADMGTPSP